VRRRAREEERRARRARGRAHQRDVVAVEEDRVQPSYPFALRGDLAATAGQRAVCAWGSRRSAGGVPGAARGQSRGSGVHALFRHVLEHHVDVVVEAWLGSGLGLDESSVRVLVKFLPMRASRG